MDALVAKDEFDHRNINRVHFKTKQCLNGRKIEKKIGPIFSDIIIGAGEEE